MKSNKNLPPKNQLKAPPEHYFDLLPDKTLSRIKHEKRKIIPISAIGPTIAAAVIAMIIVFNFNTLFVNTEPQETFTVKDLSNTDLEAYLYYAEVHEEELIDLLPEEELLLQEMVSAIDDVEDLEDFPVDISIYDLY